MIHIKDDIYFDDTKPFEEQSEAFRAYANKVFETNDYTDMSNLKPDNTCSWTQKKDGLMFTAKRVYLNPKLYTVKEHLFTVKII